ncbi:MULTISPECIES: Holliday junction branch migration protein RuvA [Atopobiaceae]|uniref:Holliday junction branch migration protein RuvA n=1 Tax=Atopobiaceae TaxID=1643824 RepID=UPI00034E92B4|nr:MULTISPECIES: Holliday junction branch migration protein RuvA [Atopobiaceae]EPD77884.1 Holliday junction DNA helicase RuvA [Atopobium sp. oral taxon 199 str. F0494]
MIVQLTGTLLFVSPSLMILDVHGVGYELGISANTAAALPQVGEAGVTILTRMVVREDAMELYGFSSREERALFDRLRAISGIGAKLALSVLSTFTPRQLAGIVASEDSARMTQVAGLGKKKAGRMVVELSDVFAKDTELRNLVGLSGPTEALGFGAAASSHAPLDNEVTEALLAMGFTSQEIALALEGREEAGASTIEKAISYALRRLGSGN